MRNVRAVDYNGCHAYAPGLRACINLANLDFASIPREYAQPPEDITRCISVDIRTLDVLVNRRIFQNGNVEAVVEFYRSEQ